MTVVLFVSVFAIATCGLIYQLIAATAASYLLGDSITQFSTIIGCYLFSMGIGSWLSKYIHRNLELTFVLTELLIGVIGGSSAALLFILFDFASSFRVILYFLVANIGTLVGLEIPLLLRILKDKFEFKDLVSHIFTFDYIGALFASLIFPLVLVPYLGLVKSGFFFGICNVLVALWALYIFKETYAVRQYRFLGYAALFYLLLGLVFSEALTSLAETNAYTSNIIYSKSTPYQRIVVTKHQKDIKLYLNGNLQFSTLDEYRYHESLVHPVLSSRKTLPKHILVLGGGDGLAVREILKYSSVETIDLVELDKQMITLFKTNSLLKKLNYNAFHNPKVNVIINDAFQWIKQEVQKEPSQRKAYDAVIIDFPDPSNYSVGKLYTLTFYKQLYNFLPQESAIVIQSTSPLFARKSFWCIHNTVKEAGFSTFPYHAYVPSFGEWGYVLAVKGEDPDLLFTSTPKDLRFINDASMKNLFVFSPDISYIPTKIHKLDSQALVQYFDQEWGEITAF
jgi:spermidine synthase